MSFDEGIGVPITKFLSAIESYITYWREPSNHIRERCSFLVEKNMEATLQEKKLAVPNIPIDDQVCSVAMPVASNQFATVSRPAARYARRS